MADAWYYKVHGQEQGPVAFDEISEMAHSGQLSPSDEIRFGETADWMAAKSVDGLFPDSDEPEELSDLDDLNFSFENSEAATPSSIENSEPTVDGVADLNDLSDLNFNFVSEEPRRHVMDARGGAFAGAGDVENTDVVLPEPAQQLRR